MATKLSPWRKVEPAALDQRTGPRYRVAVSRASVRGHGQQPQAALLHDLSAYGCRLSGVDDQPEGERLWLRLAGSLPVAATVVWARDDQLGCRFDAPLDRALMRALTLGIHPVAD